MGKKRAYSNPDLKPGDVFEVPVKKHGNVALVVVRTPHPADPVQACVCYCSVDPVSRTLSKNRIVSPEEWGRGWVGFVENKTLVSGFWNPLSPVSDFDSERWPVPPFRTSDEQPFALEFHDPQCCMRLIACEPCDEAGFQFPSFDFVSQVRKFERGLQDCLDHVRPGFFGQDIRPVELNGDVIRLWQSARPATAGSWPAHCDGEAGRTKASPNVSPGDVVAVPLVSGGFGILVVARREPKHPRNGWAIWFGLDARFATPPSMNEVGQVDITQAVLVSRACDFQVRGGRWVLIGRVKGFDSASWPVTPLVRSIGFQTEGRRTVSIESFDTWTVMQDVAHQPIHDDVESDSEMLARYCSPRSVEWHLDARLRGDPNADPDWIMDEARARRWRHYQEKWRSW